MINIGEKMQLRLGKHTVGLYMTVKSANSTPRVSKPLSKTAPGRLRAPYLRETGSLSPEVDRWSLANETSIRRECTICTAIKSQTESESCFPQLDSCAHEPLTCTDCMHRQEHHHHAAITRSGDILPRRDEEPKPKEAPRSSLVALQLSAMR